MVNKYTNVYIDIKKRHVERFIYVSLMFYYMTKKRGLKAPFYGCVFKNSCKAIVLS